MIPATRARATSSADVLEVVVVEVDGRRCAIPARHVVELVRIAAVTPLPRTPPVVEGVINVRGVVLPVLDVRARLGLPRRPVQLTDHLVVARAGARLVALRVDRALDVLAVPLVQLDAVVALPEADDLLGVATLDDGLLLVYDVASFLSAEEAGVLDAALAGAATTAPTTVEPGRP